MQVAGLPLAGQSRGRNVPGIAAPPVCPLGEFLAENDAVFWGSGALGGRLGVGVDHEIFFGRLLHRVEVDGPN